MSYRLIDANMLTMYANADDAPCIYADLPNGLDGNHYIMEQPESNRESRWFELFGTPEKAARTLHHNGTLVCRECLIREECAKTPEDSDCMIMRYDALLEWLRGDAE